MTTNRNYINDLDIVLPAQIVEKGLPLPGLGGRLVVNDGWRAVITQGGRYHGTLEPGEHSTSQFSYWQDIRAYLVDTRRQNLDIITSRELTIHDPVPVQLDLSFSVEYQVIPEQARRVALEVKTPLTSLFDRALQAVRGVITRVNIDEVRRQGEGIARTALQNLQGMRLEHTLGIEVFDVQIVTIKALDTNGDALADLTRRIYEETTNAQLQAMILANTNVTWEWLVINRPEIAMLEMKNRGDLAKLWVENNLVLGPAGALMQQTGSAGAVPYSDSSGLDRLTSLISSTRSQSGAPQLLGQGPTLPQLTQSNALSRLREERTMITTGIPGASAKLRAVDDDTGTPNGSYALEVTLPRTIGGVFHVRFECPSTYPQAAPGITLIVDDQEMPYNPPLLAHWTSNNYLIELLRLASQVPGVG